MLKAKEIKQKLALPKTPTFISTVTVPAGTTMYAGVVSPNRYGSGLGIQFEFKNRPSAEWFSNITKLN